MKSNFAWVLLLILSGVSARSADSAASKPAQVENPVTESSLSTVKLTPAAEQRLGIVLAEAVRKSVAVTRVFGGDVIRPPVAKGEKPANYFPLAAITHDELLRLADQQAIADGEVEKAKVQFEAAQVTLKRAETLARGEAGSARAVDDAMAQSRLAEKSLEIARTRRALLGGAVTDTAGGRVWVRVPVYVGEMRMIDTAVEGRVANLTARPGETNWGAKLVSTPASANAGSATVDLFYEVAGAAGALTPGQRVSMSLPLRGQEEGLVVPWAAVLHDIHGNAWVYENTAPRTFVRRRVSVSRVVGGDAVLASGPKPGTKVVTDGAAELFGTEFGIGK